MKRVLRIGLPAGIQSIMYNISNMIIQAKINGYGTDAAAAWAAFGKLDAVFWLIIRLDFLFFWSTKRVHTFQTFLQFIRVM